MRERLHVYIGYDSREKAAYDVAAESARDFGCEVTPIYEDRLRSAGLLTRPTDRRGGQQWDFNSNAPQSTDFATSRFWAPILCHDGYCLFTDCDVVFLANPHGVLEYCDPSKAVSVVKHKQPVGDTVKMDGQTQTQYARKNWSSVALYNCNHPATKRMNVSMLNQWPGRDLHAFAWLHDDEIGELPPRWNWLVGVQPKPEDPAIAHFTLGVPSLAGHENDAHADIWWERHSSR